MNNKRVNPEHIQCMIKLCNETPYNKYLGLKMTSIEKGRATIELKLNQNHINTYGGLHGGAYASLIDMVTYWAAYCDVGENDGYTTIDITANYFASVIEGTLYGEAKVVRSGRTLMMTEVDVKDDRGRIVAHGTSKLLVVPGKMTQENLKNNFGVDEIPPKFV